MAAAGGGRSSRTWGLWRASRQARRQACYPWQDRGRHSMARCGARFVAASGGTGRAPSSTNTRVVAHLNHWATQGKTLGSPWLVWHAPWLHLLSQPPLSTPSPTPPNWSRAVITGAGGAASAGGRGCRGLLLPLVRAGAGCRPSGGAGQVGNMCGLWHGENNLLGGERAGGYLRSKP